MLFGSSYFYILYIYVFVHVHAFGNGKNFLFYYIPVKLKAIFALHLYIFPVCEACETGQEHIQVIFHPKIEITPYIYIYEAVI